MTSSEAPPKFSPAGQFNGQSSWKILFVYILLMFATTFTPPLARMFGSQIWSGLEITEGLSYTLSPMFVEQISQNVGAQWACPLFIGLGIAALAYSIKIIPTVPTMRSKVIPVLVQNLWVGGLCTVVFAIIMAGIVGWSSILVWFTLCVRAITLTGLNSTPIKDGFALAPLLAGPILFGAIVAQLNLRFGARISLLIG